VVLVRCVTGFLALVVAGIGRLDALTPDQFADLAEQEARNRIENAITQGQVSGRVWASQPGRISVLDAGSLTFVLQADLWSKSTGPTFESVNLNRKLGGGARLIHSGIGGGSAPEFPVEWVVVAQNPGEPVGPGNPVVGRYAWWADDDTARIDLNAAAGVAFDLLDPVGNWNPDLDGDTFADPTNVTRSKPA